MTATKTNNNLSTIDKNINQMSSYSTIILVMLGQANWHLLCDQRDIHTVLNKF